MQIKQNYKDCSIKQGYFNFKTPSFWGGFITGILSSLVATAIWNGF